MATWAVGTWADNTWAENTWLGDTPVPPDDELSVPTGVSVDEFGAVFYILVSQTFTGNPGDVIINGTRYSVDGAMYVTTDAP